ncbi:MAG: hypothetical protein H6Q67_2084 [Firmicutes bacterium]|nr:hypothetical protein [Bacillota bacterium]
MRIRWKRYIALLRQEGYDEGFDLAGRGLANLDFY